MALFVTIVAPNDFRILRGLFLAQIGGSLLDRDDCNAIPVGDEVVDVGE
jgi:hypothetical protein